MTIKSYIAVFISCSFIFAMFALSSCAPSNATEKKSISERLRPSGELAGEPAGERAGGSAGKPAGKEAGKPAGGETAGKPAGERAGKPAGREVRDRDEMRERERSPKMSLTENDSTTGWVVLVLAVCLTAIIFFIRHSRPERK